MGFCLLWRGDFSGAANYLQQALAIAERTGQADFQLLSLTYLSVAYRMQGDTVRTREVSERHLAYVPSVQVPPYSDTAHANLAWVAWKEGDQIAAELHARKSWEALPGSQSFVCVVVWPLVAVSLARGHVGNAVGYASTQQTVRATEPVPDTLLALVQRAAEAWDGQRPDEAAAYLQQALSIAQDCHFL
jgi:ATP/maltotriose-dependent transcriptional regulator MalT